MTMEVSSPFMRLPLELPEQVYGYAPTGRDSQPRVLVDPEQNDSLRAATHEEDEEFRPALAVFLVSKKIYQEASTVFYNNVTFQLDCFDQLTVRGRSEPTLHFLQSRPPGALAKI